MIQYERLNPMKWKRIYRSKYNPRKKCVDKNIKEMKIFQEKQAQKAPDGLEYLTLQNLARKDSIKKFKLRDQEKFFTCPYRAANPNIVRE